MPRWRLVAAAAWVFVSNAALAWWVKGDLEMAWLIGLPVIFAGGLVFGALSAFLLRSLRASLAMTGASVVWSVILAYTALNTPHSWKQPPAGLAEAKRFSTDREAIRTAAIKAAGYPVEPMMPAQLEPRNSVVTKEGFSFALVRRPGAARIWVSFDVGPQSGIQFDVVPRGGAWELRPRSAPSGMVIVRAPALERRFPQARLIEAGGNGPYAPGEIVPVRIARSETDWDIALLRIASAGEPLREVRRYTREELMRRFTELVNAAGIGPLESALIYFRPVKTQDVLFHQQPKFNFIGVLGNRRYWRVQVTASLAAGGALDFTIERPLTRPAPGALAGVGDRR